MVKFFNQICLRFSKKRNGDTSPIILRERTEMDNRLEKALHKQEALFEVQKSETESIKSELDKHKAEQEILEQVNLFLSNQIKDKVSSVKYQIESLVNQGLKYIFSAPDTSTIQIEIKSEFKNNKTIFSLNIKKDGVNEGQADAFGGGVLSVISLLLRVSSICIDNTERLLILDETTAFVSKQYQPLVSQFLQKLCDQLGFTIVLIAHQQDMATYADNIYQATGNPENGISFRKISFEDF